MNRSSSMLLEESLPAAWPQGSAADCYLSVAVYGEALDPALVKELFPRAKSIADFSAQAHQLIWLREMKAGVMHPMAQSLAKATGISPDRIVIDRLIIVNAESVNPDSEKLLNSLWKEPAIEEIRSLKFGEWAELRSQRPLLPRREEISFLPIEDASGIGLDFSNEELAVIQAESTRLGRSLTRAEWELLAQTWSEHCKHKIFNAEISGPEIKGGKVRSIFKQFLRAPTEEIRKQKENTYLSVFTDNAGVVRLYDWDARPTNWALSMKMETHNSPSAISPYGGASTGIVGVHRDILGTGLGSMPIASWDVLCFESPGNAEHRPPNALDADIIRSGVIRGIQDGGNQSGIPTVQGSIVFSDSYSAKPLVFAGTLGLLRDHYVQKKAKVGDTLFAVGGAVGPDGLRGAVMSSRDLRTEDMMGSAVQVAQPFVQRMVTDFLLKARDEEMITSITDNGAGGLASSVGEMAQSTRGARIDLSHLRLKFEGLLAWERLLSESQERMTVATDQPEAFEALARDYQVDCDRLGHLTDDGHFRVSCFGKSLVDLSLDFLHDACPQMKITTQWTLARDLEHARKSRPGKIKSSKGKVFEDFQTMLAHPHLVSREGVPRRFDHEVQGRTLQLPFQGGSQKSPADGSQLEIYEAERVNVSLAHGLAPWRRDIHENVFLSIDEALRSAVLSGMHLETAGFLDNFSWPDPLPHPQRPQSERYLWRLVRSCEVLAQAARTFQIPFISGKDSMKNNQGVFDIEETLVVSVAGSSAANAMVPASFIARANEVVFYLPPLTATLKDSVWDRVFAGANPNERLFQSQTLEALDQEITDIFQKLRLRYKNVEKALRKGLLRSAKDVGEGGFLTALFEMARGRRLGVEFEAREWSSNDLFQEGAGAMIITCDLHALKDLTETLPELRRVGVTSARYVFNFPLEGILDLEKCDEAYESGNHGGLWS